MSVRYCHGARTHGWRAVAQVSIALAASAAARAATPTLDSISPDETSELSMDLITAVGSLLEPGATVYIRPSGSSTWSECFMFFVSSSMVRFLPSTFVPGANDVRVMNPGGETADLLGALTILPLPRIDSVSPSFGTAAGGTALTISGRGFNTSVSCEATLCDSLEPLVGQVVNVDETVITGTTPAYPSSLPLGNVAGFPGTVGQHDFTVTADDGSTSDTATFRVCVSGIVITPVSSAPAVLNVSYSQSFQAMGGVAPFAWSLTGTLPNGMALAPTGATTCEIAGTPTETGTFSVTLNVTDDTSPTPLAGARQLDVIVHPDTSLTVTTNTLPLGKVGVYYEAQLAVVGGTATYSWAPASGSLPTGLGLSAGGLISGTPTAVGAPFSFSVDVSDSTAPTALTATKAFTITITAASDVGFDMSGLRYDSGDGVWLLPDAILGAPYEHSLELMGVPAALFILASGAMPDGLHLNADLVPVRVRANVLGLIVQDTEYAFVYVPANGDVTDIAPVLGPASGGTPVTVTGTGFVDGARVFFGPSEATSVVWSNSTSLTCLSPASAEEASVGIRVLNPDGSASEGFDLFAYRFTPTLTGIGGGSDDWDFFSGGREIALVGTNFADGDTTVTIDGAPATVTAWTSDTEITVLVPEASPSAFEGYVDVTVSNIAGGETEPALFYYVDEPPTSVFLTSPAAGDTVALTITLTADALDDRAVIGVLFQYSTVDAVTGPWTDIPPGTAALPYSVEFDTTLVPDGPCHLRAVATDDHVATAVNAAAQQSTASAAVTVTISQPVPEDGGCTPGAGSSAGGLLLCLCAAALVVSKRRRRRA